MYDSPRFLRTGPYIISLDFIHGVLATMTDSEDAPFQIFITYTDGKSIGIECKDLETKNLIMDKISEALGAI